MDIEIGPEITAPAPAIRRPRTRIPHENSRLYRWLEGHPAAVAFELPEMATFALLTVDELGGLSAAIATGIRTALGGGNGVKPTTPDLDCQLAEFESWQRARSAIYAWSPDEMDNLRRKVDALGPGVEILPAFAMSCYLKLPSGRLLLVDRAGCEVKS
jgi:hypothetical protein